jgi:flagellar biosynthesis/type III secretory pathway M-ring protein FliF/YscJ
MSTTNIAWIVIAVIGAVLVIATLIFAVNRATRRRRQRQAEEIREQAKLGTTRVERRQALADETAAKARAAQAEAEAKAAEAARLQERAASHQSEAARSREQLQEQWNQADSVDPRVTTETRETPDRPTPAREEERHRDAETHRASG